MQPNTDAEVRSIPRCEREKIVYAWNAEERATIVRCPLRRSALELILEGGIGHCGHAGPDA